MSDTKHQSSQRSAGANVSADSAPTHRLALLIAVLAGPSALLASGVLPLQLFGAVGTGGVAGLALADRRLKLWFRIGLWSVALPIVFGGLLLGIATGLPTLYGFAAQVVGFTAGVAWGVRDPRALGRWLGFGPGAYRTRRVIAGDAPGAILELSGRSAVGGSGTGSGAEPSTGDQAIAAAAGVDGTGAPPQTSEAGGSRGVSDVRMKALEAELNEARWRIRALEGEVHGLRTKLALRGEQHEQELAAWRRRLDAAEALARTSSGRLHEVETVAMRRMAQADGAGDWRMQEVKRAFARRFHPDHALGSQAERIMRSEMFKEFWAELERIERTQTGRSLPQVR